MREYGARSRFTIGADESIVHTVFEHARRSPQRVLFSRPIADEWVDVTATEFADLVTGVAKGLVASGVAPGDRVVLLSATRFEWTLFDFAIWAAGAVSVPIYDSSSPEQVQWIVEDSGAVLAIVERAQHAAGFADAGPGLTRVLQIDDRAVEKLIAEGAGLADDVVRQRIAG